jgi:hypothetical protein
MQRVDAAKASTDYQHIILNAFVWLRTNAAHGSGIIAIYEHCVPLRCERACSVVVMVPAIAYTKLSASPSTYNENSTSSSIDRWILVGRALLIKCSLSRAHFVK